MTAHREGWVSLRDHMEALRRADQQAVRLERELRTEIAKRDQRALKLAAKGQEKIDEHLNQVRHDVLADRAMYVTHAESEAKSEAAAAALAALTEQVSAMRNAALGSQRAVAVMLSVATTLIALLVYVTR